jgi:hypothetical protein
MLVLQRTFLILFRIFIIGLSLCSYICILAFVMVRLDNVVPLGFMFGQIDDPVFNRTVNDYFFSLVPLLVAGILTVWIPASQTKK